jgi:hypothetical protein
VKTNPISPRASRAARVGGFAFVLLALHACGGGGDESGPVPSPDPATAKMSDCFNVTAVLTEGWRDDVTWRTTDYDTSGNATHTFVARIVRTTGGIVNFDGALRRDMTATLTTSITANGVTSASSGTSHIYVDTDGRSLLEYGTTSDSTITSTGATTTTIRFESRTIRTPPLATPLDLRVGQSASHSGTEQTTSTTTIDGVTQAPTSTSETVNDISRFTAVEQVTVPAGTFTACKLDSLSSSGVVLESTWTLFGKGSPLRSDVFSSTGVLESRSEATALTINGSAP